MKSHIPNKQGFTLIELLVVIAIIAILAAILFPVFARAREKARQTHCLGNIKQLGNAFRMYLDDWDNTFPGAGCVNGSLSNPNAKSNDWVVSWDHHMISVTRGSIFPYVKNIDSYYCLSDPASQFKSPKTDRLSYGMNTCLWSKSESNVRFPSSTILLMEESEKSALQQGLNDGCFFPYFPNDLPANRHSRGGNYLLADTHAKWLPETDLIFVSNQKRGGKWAWYDPFRTSETEPNIPQLQARCTQPD